MGDGATNAAQLCRITPQPWCSVRWTLGADAANLRGDRMQLALRKIIVIAMLLVLVTGCAVTADEYRAFWIDAWHAGFLNQSQVDSLLGVVGSSTSKGTIRDANCNAVVIQIRRNADVCYPSAKGEPYFSGLSPSTFNALQAVINAAHDTTGGKQRIEVHCWMVTFRTSGGVVYDLHNDTPTGSLTSLDNYWITRTEAGGETSSYAFDPGHPLAEEYLVDVAMDLVNNFDIDGIHYDYVRFEANSEGYNPTSVARYNARYGLTGQPVSTDQQFKQWRRDQITSYVRKVYAKIQASKPSVKQSGAFVTWNPSPANSTRAAFQATRPYYDVYSDWDAWMQEGILDMAIPMTYYNYASLPGDYTKWMNFEKDRKFNRHMIVGPGIYLNSLSNAILELQMTRNASPAGNYADGFCGYSYFLPYASGSWAGFSPTFISQVSPSPVNIPTMPWKTAPTKGHISGTVTYLTGGAWADGATVTISGPESRSMYCDGTGFYAFIDLTPGAYLVTASKTGYPSSQKAVTVAIGSVTGNMYVTDFALGGTPAPTISNVQATNVTTTGATITWTTDQAATSQLQYGTTAGYGTTTPLDSNLVTSHSVTLSGLVPKTPYHFMVTSTNTNGSTSSIDYTFVTYGPPAISNVQVTNIGSDSATITWATDAPADSTVDYGMSSSYGSQASSSTAVTSHSLTLSGLSATTTYHYKLTSANAYGSAQTTDATFATTEVVTEIVIDNLDPGWSNTSPNDNTWKSGASGSVPKIETNYLYSSGDGSTTESSITRKCRWTPDLSTAGNYDVYVFYQIGQNRNEEAPYTVYYDGGQVTSVQNQYSATPNLGGWYLIGEDLPFAAGSSGYVEVTTLCTDTKYVSADAAKWVLKSVPDTTLPVINSVTITPSMVASGDGATITAVVTDNVGVAGVAANGVALVNTGGNTWTGTLTAVGTPGAEPILSSVVVGAEDAAGKAAQNVSAAYAVAKVYALTNRSLAGAGSVDQSVEKYLFKTWGSVASVNGDYFDLNDGSPTSVRVYCPSHGLAVNDFVSACGVWNVAVTPHVLDCQVSQIRKLK